MEVHPAAAALTVVGAFAGGMAGAWLALPRPGPAPVEVVEASAPAPPVAAAAPETLEACLSQLDAWTALYEAQQREAVGTPVPFPEELADAWLPADFEANVVDALAACPALGLELLAVDCEEYPCLAWLEVGPDAPDPDAGLGACGWWAERYPGHEAVAASGVLVDGDGLERRFLAWGAQAPGVSPAGGDLNASTRLTLRFEAGRERWMAEWSARELSDAESRARSLELLRQRAAGGDEGARRVLELLGD